jgi:O-antigen/teichoic acid export membrane protein
MKQVLDHKDVLWGYAAALMNLAGGVLLLPLLMVHLTQEEIGLWFVFLTMAGFVQLMETSLQPTVARLGAYVCAGARSIDANGTQLKELNDIAPCKDIDQKLFSTLYEAARTCYLFVALMLAVVLLFGGGAYVGYLQKTSIGLDTMLISWVLFSLGFIVNAGFGYINAFLIARGDITQHNKVVAITRAAFLVLGALGLVLGYKLFGIGVASLVSAVLGRLLARHYIGKGIYPQSNSIYPRWRNPALQHLWPNSLKMMLVQLGAFLIVRSNVLIASSFLGLSLVASYGITVQLILVLAGLSSMMLNLQLPQMNALQVADNRLELQKIFSLALISSWVVFITGSIVMIFIGDPVTELIGAKAALLPLPSLAVLIMIGFLEVNHSISAVYLTTLNKIPFVNAALYSGIANVTVGILLCGFFNMGLWGLILAQGSVQLMYNNWKWPKAAMDDLKLNVRDVIRLGLPEMMRLLRGR